MASGLAKGIEHISRGLRRKDDRLRQERIDSIAEEDRNFTRGRLEREEGRIIEDRDRRIKKEDEDRKFEIENRGLQRRGQEAEVKIRESAAQQAHRDLISDTLQRKQEALAALSEDSSPDSIQGIIEGLNQTTGTEIDPQSLEFLPDGSISYTTIAREDINGEPGFGFQGEREIIPASLIKAARHRIARRDLGDAVEFGPDNWMAYNPDSGKYERIRGITSKSEDLAVSRIEKKMDSVDEKLEGIVEGSPSQREWADQMVEYTSEAMKLNPPRPGNPSIRSLDARTVKRVISNILKTTEDLDVIEKSMKDQDFSNDEIMQEKLLIQEDVLNMLDLALRDAAGIQVSAQTRRLLSTPRKGPRAKRADRDSRPGLLSETAQGVGAFLREGLSRANDSAPGAGEPFLAR